MITLPTELEKFMQGQDLTGLKPFALLYRNKWNSVTEKYELDTTPIDISAHITKPNTLSMTLDVNEVAQYNANNVTLSLSDTKNQFVEGTPGSYFPAGYQIYGSKVVLYYGITSPINPYPTQVGYTVVGTPTISENGVVSDFATSSFLATPPFNPGANPWELVFEFTTGTTFKSQGVMTKIGNDKGLTPLYINSAGNMAIWASSNGTVEDIANSVIYGPCAANTTYRIKQKFTGTNYKIYLWENNSWSLKKTINSSMPIYGSTPFAFGNNGGNTSPFRGTINIKNTYVKINGEYWFNGAHFFYEPQATPLFTGVIKEPPTHKPEKYQVDVKLVSPLEMLKDIEAKDFSDKVTGETLTYKSTDSDGHRIYWTSGTGVGGFDAVYADGVKLFEGVDYEVEQLNELVKPAIVTIINSAHYSATITADYYTWKRDLTVEQIVAGLVGLAGYDSATEDIRKVVWNTSVRNQPVDSTFFAGIGYYESDEHEYSFNWRPTRNSNWAYTTSGSCKNTLPSNWDYSFAISVNNEGQGGAKVTGVTILSIGDQYNGNEIKIDHENVGVVGVNNGLSFRIFKQRQGGFPVTTTTNVYIHRISNGNATLLYSYTPTNSGTTVQSGQLKITRRGNDIAIYKEDTQIATATITGSMDYLFQGEYRVGSSANVKDFWVYSQSWNIYDNNLRLYAGNITRPCFISDICDKTAAGDAWGEISATLTGNGSYFLNAYFSSDLTTWTEPEAYNLNTVIARNERYLYYVLGVSSKPNAGFRINDPTTYYLANTLLLKMVNLSGLTVLEALQDFALISGYEFGVDRNGIFFFRPRVASTNPVYELGHNEVAKVETVKKNLSDFFTKLTLTFAQGPLEFYANTGTRPTAVDKYGIINKDIDKPDIVNYDNPEIAQAIGPQLLEVYAAFPDVIQVVGKLNLALELADIVNLKRNYNLVEPESASDYTKYEAQQTYYRACKIIGMNYNFAKRQITYTLRDVSNANNMPHINAYGFPYDLPIQLGKLKTE